MIKVDWELLDLMVLNSTYSMSSESGRNMGDKHQPKCPTNPMSHLFLNWQCQCNVDGIRFGSVWQIESRCEHNTNPKKEMSAEIQLWRKKRVNPNQLMCELDWGYFPPWGSSEEGSWAEPEAYQAQQPYFRANRASISRF